MSDNYYKSIPRDHPYQKIPCEYWPDNPYPEGDRRRDSPFAHGCFMAMGIVSIPLLIYAAYEIRDECKTKVVSKPPIVQQQLQK